MTTTPIFAATLYDRETKQCYGPVFNSVGEGEFFLRWLAAIDAPPPETLKEGVVLVLYHDSWVAQGCPEVVTE